MHTAIPLSKHHSYITNIHTRLKAVRTKTSFTIYSRERSIPYTKIVNEMSFQNPEKCQISRVAGRIRRTLSNVSIYLPYNKPCYPLLRYTRSLIGPMVKTVRFGNINAALKYPRTIKSIITRSKCVTMMENFHPNLLTSDCLNRSPRLSSILFNLGINSHVQRLSEEGI